MKLLGGISTLFILYSCAFEQPEENTNATYRSFCGEIPKGDILCCYENNGKPTYLLEIIESKCVLLLVYDQNKLCIQDTLIKTRNIFHSKRNKTSYQITGKMVVITQYQKMVHPSSNWQGQAPWYEKTVYRYARLK